MTPKEHDNLPAASDRRRHALRMAMRPMSKRMAAFVVIPAVFAAGALAFYRVERLPETTAAGAFGGSAAALVPAGAVLPSESREMLPPNHPPVGPATSPDGWLPSAGSDAPAIVWKMPSGWQEAPSPNAMRLATYRAPGGVEVSVSRAGGATEANIQRWIAQFDDVDREDRVEKTVHGVHVVTVDIAGTYVGGGMPMEGSAEPKPNWAMVGAIVESRSPPYFLKMTGPVAAVRAARRTFDRFLESIAPT
jgi:hypothetical protein